MKQLLNICFVLLLSNGALASPGQLVVKGGTWSFATENVRNTNETNSGVGAYSFELGYSFSSRWLVVIGFNLLMSDIFQGSSGYGFDIGAKYFPFSEAGTTRLEGESTLLTVREAWRPYVGAFMRQRLFGLEVSTSYLGPGVSVGLDYGLSSQWLLNAELRYDYLYGSGDALAIQSNLLIGLGFEF